MNDDDIQRLRLAMQFEGADNFKSGIEEEMNSLQNTNTWEIVNKPKRSKI